MVMTETVGKEMQKRYLLCPQGSEKIAAIATLKLVKRLWTLMRSGTNVFEGQGQLVDWLHTKVVTDHKMIFISEVVLASA